MAILTILLWLAATTLVFATAARLAERLGLGGGSALIAHALVIGWSWIVLTAVGLSLCRSLSGWNLMLGTSAIALATLIGVRRFLRDCPAAAPIGGVEGSPPPAWVKAAWVLLLAFWSSHAINRGLMAFTGEFDSLMYHIPLVDYWLQAASLYAPDSSHWSNPGANEVLGLWAVAPFPGDFLISLNNLPSVLLLGFGTLELAALIGLSGVLRHLATFAVVANFVVISQLVDAGNDVAVVALFVACLAYGFRHARGGRFADLAMFAASLGLLGGVKYYALGYAAVALGSTAALVKFRRGFVASARVLAAGAAGAALLGGYWYARNLLVSGSPLYPLGLGASTDLLREEYPRIWESTFLRNGRPEVWELGLQAVWKMSGSCQLFAILALPSTVAWLAATGIRSASSESRRGLSPERLALVLALVGSGAVLLVTPMALEDVPGTLNHLRWAYTPVRYGLSFLTLAVLALALSLQELFMRVRPPLSRLPHAFLLGSAAYQIIFLDGRHQVDWTADALTCLSIVLVFGAGSLLGRIRPALARFASLAAGCVAVVAAVFGLGQLERTWEEGFTRHYESFYNTRVFTAIDALRPAPTRVGLFDYRCYPFFGARRQYRLCQPKRVPSYNWLVPYLEGRGVTHVVVRSHESDSPAGWDAYIHIRNIIDMHPNGFRKVHEDKEFCIYEFRLGGLPEIDPQISTSSSNNGGFEPPQSDRIGR